MSIGSASKGGGQAKERGDERRSLSRIYIISTLPHREVNTINGWLVLGFFVQEKTRRKIDLYQSVLDKLVAPGGLRLFAGSRGWQASWPRFGRYIDYSESAILSSDSDSGRRFGHAAFKTLNNVDIEKHSYSTLNTCWDYR